VGDEIGVDWSRFDLERFRLAMHVEFEHALATRRPMYPRRSDRDREVALAHVKEFPDYYEQLERMERDAERELADRPR
jgi:hypothetical protein